MGHFQTLLFTFLGLTPLISAYTISRSSFIGPAKPYAYDANFALGHLSAEDPDGQFPQVGTELWNQLNATVHNTEFLGVDWRTNKRGIAYNNPNFPPLFLENGGAKVSWMYDWWSLPGGQTHVGYEFIPMLHSYRPEHTNIWFSNVNNCQKVIGSVGVFSFNEPDQCG